MRDDKVCHIPRDRSIILLVPWSFLCSCVTTFNDRFNSGRKFFSKKKKKNPLPSILYNTELRNGINT